ncbi:uncharacterized protein [Palaemon carinicauda]|uniref:uncharacterized protein n=1 Tax=Palaemon carinicauda TaxID=392227 RepID=UPI0035B5B4CD
MWIFFRSFPRGVRTARPSNCCTQNNGDDIGKNFSNEKSIQSSSIVCHTKSSIGSREHGCHLVKLSKCIYHRLPKWGSCDVNLSNHPKFKWIWATSCTYPYLRDYKDESGREKWTRFNRRRQQILISNTILNAVGWGSAAAFTWNLCQYLRSYFFLFNNSSYQNSGNDVSESIAICEDNKDASEEEDDNKINLKYGIINDWSQFRNIHFPLHTLQSWIGLQNEKQRAHIFNQKANVPNEESIYSVFSDIKPQIEDDNDYLQSQVAKTTQDSGFSEYEWSDKNNSQSSKNILLGTSVSTQTLQESRLEQEDVLVQKGSTHDIAGNENNESDKCTDLDIKKQNNFAFRTVSVKDFESYASSSAESETSETSSSPIQYSHGTNKADLNNGLEAVIEAGKKEINNFSMELLGILEERMNRYIAHDHPKEAVPYFHAGTLMGDASSHYNLALCYHMGYGIKQDFQKARELYETASLLGHGWATYNLAVMLIEGQGGISDSIKAHSLIIKAAKLGVKRAQMALEQMQKPKEDQVVSISRESATSLTSIKSEPVPLSHYSQEFLSTYAFSTNDLDFLEESVEPNVDVLSDLSMKTTSRPRFYLE